MNYDTLDLSAERRVEWGGFCDDGVVALLAHWTRPLRGLWATPPFLHDGSVLSLYQMLLSADQRDKTFYVGSREVDPQKRRIQHGEVRRRL
jgi:hypothetical protein